jgi:hypothetical protein
MSRTFPYHLSQKGLPLSMLHITLPTHGTSAGDHHLVSSDSNIVPGPSKAPDLEELNKFLESLIEALQGVYAGNVSVRCEASYPIMIQLWAQS